LGEPAPLAPVLPELVPLELELESRVEGGALPVAPLGAPFAFEPCALLEPPPAVPGSELLPVPTPDWACATAATPSAPAIATAYSKP
jgi:hypothetical protein